VLDSSSLTSPNEEIIYPAVATVFLARFQCQFTQINVANSRRMSGDKALGDLLNLFLRIIRGVVIILLDIVCCWTEPLKLYRNPALV